MARRVPAVSDFLKMHLAVFTPDSALPLDLLRPGLLVRCSKSHVLAKSANSLEDILVMASTLAGSDFRPVLIRR